MKRAAMIPRFIYRNWDPTRSETSKSKSQSVSWVLFSAKDHPLLARVSTNLPPPSVLFPLSSILFVRVGQIVLEPLVK